MNNSFSSYLAQLNLVDKQDMKSVTSLFKPLSLKKQDFFVLENSACNSIGFILRGAVRTFSTNEHGEENTTCFKFENQFITSFDSFIFQKPSEKSIQAIEDCDLVVIDHSSFLKLLKQIPALQTLQQLITQQEFIEKENYLIHLKNKTAKEKYLYILNEQPELVQRVAVNHLASYLGMTQRTLTRVKKDVLQTAF